MTFGAGARMCGELGLGETSPDAKATGRTAGDRFEGRVLLLLKPLPLTPPTATPTLLTTGLPLDLRDVTETFLRIPPYFLTSSAPALPFEGDLPTIVFERLGDEGVFGPPRLF